MGVKRHIKSQVDEVLVPGERGKRNEEYQVRNSVRSLETLSRASVTA